MIEIMKYALPAEAGEIGKKEFMITWSKLESYVFRRSSSMALYHNLNTS